MNSVLQNDKIYNNKNDECKELKIITVKDPTYVVAKKA